MIGKPEDLKILDEMVTAVMAGPAHSSAFVSQASQFISGSDQQTARSQIVSISRLLSAPRWWQAHLQESHIQQTLATKNFKFHAPVGTPKQVLKTLQERLTGAEAIVLADLKACEPHKERVLAKSLPDDPYFHFERFGEELAADLGLARQLCAAGQCSSDEDAVLVLEFLKDLSENLLAGEALIQSLADHVNKEANQAGR